MRREKDIAGRKASAPASTSRLSVAGPLSQHQGLQSCGHIMKACLSSHSTVPGKTVPHGQLSLTQLRFLAFSHVPKGIFACHPPAHAVWSKALSVEPGTYTAIPHVPDFPLSMAQVKINDTETVTQE